MKSKELQLLRLLEIKFQAAEARVIAARETCENIDSQIKNVLERRNAQPSDPADQLNHERHIGWLDRRGRELSILAAQAAVEYNMARDTLRIEFGRKAAFAKVLEKRGLEESQRKSRQLS